MNLNTPGISSLSLLALAAPSTVLAQNQGENASEPNLLIWIVPGVIIASMFGIAALMKETNLARWPVALALFAVPVTGLALGGAGFVQHLMGLSAWPAAILEGAAFFVLPLFAILIWPSYWAAGGAILLFTAAYVVLPADRVEGRSMSISDLPSAFLLLIAVYALAAFGLAAFRRRRRA